MAHEDVPLPLSRLHLAKELIEDYRDLLPKLPFEEMRRIGGSRKSLRAMSGTKRLRRCLPALAAQRQAAAADAARSCARRQAGATYQTVGRAGGDLASIRSVLGSAPRLPPPLAITVREERQRQDQATEPSSPENDKVDRQRVDQTGWTVARGVAASRIQTALQQALETVRPAPRILRAGSALGV